jgi:spore coat polysaccharide biosynthesis protein SpsF
MLARQLERIKRARRLDRLVVATSVDASDDPIEALCRNEDVECYRGKLDDVLDRFYHATAPLHPEHVVRLTGDCPLTDPAVIDGVCAFYLDGGFDYATNALQPMFPDGLDVEVFRFKCMELAWREAVLPSHREHVTPFIHKNPQRFRIGHFRNDTDLSHLRWTVDEPEDFILVTKIYETLYPTDPCFDTAAILALLERHPEWKTINARHRRNEGGKKSILADAQYMKQIAEAE